MHLSRGVIEIAGRRRVAVMAKESGGGGSTLLAQGGIAAAMAPGCSAFSQGPRLAMVWGT